VCYLVLSRVPSVHDFNSITRCSPITRLISVCQRITWLRCQNHEQKVHEIEIRQHAIVIILRLSKIRWIIREPRTSQVNVRCIIPERVMHMFAMWCKPYIVLRHDATMYKAKFHSQRKKKREAYIALDLVQDHVHEAESSSSPTTTTITKIDYNSQKFNKNH
jgi:hypothetical protein